MFEKIIQLDKNALVYLNNLGTAPFDEFWFLITKQSSWIPFFLLLAYLLQRQIGWKKLGVVLFFIALILLCCNTTIELCKNHFQRLRPCNDPSVQHLIRILRQTNSFSFFSGHAANSTATMTFLFFILNKYYRNVFLIFLYPLVFAYSRIYLGVHFPIDILMGFVVGSAFGVAFFKMYEGVLRRQISAGSLGI